MIKLFVHIASGVESVIDFIGFKKVIAGLIALGFMVAIFGPIIVRAF